MSGPDNRERKLVGNTWVLLLILALQSCVIAHDVDRIADAAERAYPITKDPK